METYMSTLERVGVSLDKELLDQFDDLIKAKGYANRSEAIRDLIRGELSGEQLSKPTTEAVAGVFLVYDHHASGLTRKMIELQHSSRLQTISTMHVHLNHHDCLEVIVLRGKAGDIQKMADRLISLKGVKLGRVSLMAIEEHESHHHGHHHHHDHK